MSSSSSFQLSWLSDPQFKEWLAPDQTSNYHARCLLCHNTFTKNTINIKSMGRSALISHVKSSKHLANLKSSRSKKEEVQLTISSFVKVPASASNKSSVTASSPAPCVPTILAVKSEVARSEALWLFKTINDNRPFIANDGLDNIFAQMFPDSAIARQFKLGRTKTMYTVTHGLAPHLTNILEETVKGKHYVLLFDETMNVQLQQKQMDW